MSRELETPPRKNTYHHMVKYIDSGSIYFISVPLSSLLPSADTSPFPTPLLLAERLVERAGGTRFVKGLKGVDFQNWRGVCEGLRASREDIESVEARLDEDVRQFEQGVRTADVTTAAHKVAWQTDGWRQRPPENTIHRNSWLCIFRDAS